MGPSPFYFQSKVVFAYQVSGLKVEGLVRPNYHSKFFLPDTNPVKGVAM